MEDAKMSRAFELRQAAKDLAEEVWSDMDAVRRDTALTDAWDAAQDAAADKILVAVAAERERCIAAIEAQREIFSSPEYAAGQPLSSMSERLACNSCIDAIRRLS